MSWLDRLNRRLVAATRRDVPSKVVEENGVRLVGPGGAVTTLPFSTLTAARAELRDVFAGELVVLTLAFDDGTRVAFGEDDPAWWTLMDGLDRSGRLARPAAQWLLDGIARGKGQGAIDLLKG